MRIAIVHDWLNTTIGGAERVLFELAKAYPEADIYTLVYNEQKFKRYVSSKRVRTSFLQKLPAPIKDRPKYLLPLIPLAISRLRFDEYDVVLSSSGAWSKNITVPQHVYHICYCHSPMRFAWDYWPKYLEEQSKNPIIRSVIKFLIPRIKEWDYKKAKSVTAFLANSRTVAERIQKYYHRNSTVIYPPVETINLRPGSKVQKKDYYLTLATLTPYKKIDLAITACLEMKRKLVIIGDGSDLKRLKLLANGSPLIRFVGFVNVKRKKQLLQQAKGLLFPNEEDFGLAIVEAMAADTGVVAYNRGGASETILAGKTGILFNNQTNEGLRAAILKYESLNLKSADLTKQASRFDAKYFQAGINQTVEGARQSLVSKKVKILGVSINTVTKSMLLNYLTSVVNKRRGFCHLVTANTEFIMRAQKSKDFYRLLKNAETVIADGIGVVWASRRLKTKPVIPERITGVDLCDSLAKLAAENGWRIFLLGGYKGVAKKTAAVYSKRYPKLQIAGTFGDKEEIATQSSNQAIIKAVNSSRADILLVAYGSPKQEFWIEQNRKHLKTVKLAIGVGGTFDFVSGQVKRAPAFVQKMGLEWLWRLVLEPSRLNRQLVIPHFLWKVYKNK